MYPTTYYNTDGTTPMKHIFAGGVDAGTVKGTGAAAIMYYTHTDQLTGANVVTSSTGVQQELMDYYPFGAMRLDEKAGSFSEQRKFTGQEYDADTGLSYMNARYYNGAMGRFISQDPLSEATGGSGADQWLLDPQQQNGYSYSRNNPLVYVDPQGESAELVVKEIVFSPQVPLIGTLPLPIPGAHGFIRITAEPGENLSQYGKGPTYTISGYPSHGIGGTLQAKINNPWDLNSPESQALAIYSLTPPTGMSVADYDRKLLESGANLASQDLGKYVPTGQPISSHANSGNTATQVIINAGGTVPEIQNVYPGPAPYYRYFPLGLGNPIGTPSYAQRVERAVNNVNNFVNSTIRKAGVSLVTTTANAILNYVVKTKF